MPASMESLPIGGHEKFAEEIFGKVKDLGHVEVIQLSQAEYDALSTAEKNDPTKMYCVPGNGSFFKVIDITQAEYDELSPAEKQNPQNLYLIDDETEYLTQGGTYIKSLPYNDYGGYFIVSNDPDDMYKSGFAIGEEVRIWKKTQEDSDPAIWYRLVGGDAIQARGTKFCVDAELTNGMSVVFPTNHGKLYGGATLKADLDLATMFNHAGEHPHYWRCLVTFTAAQITDSYTDEVALISTYSAVEERTIPVSLKNGKIFTSTTGTGKTFETDYTVTANTPYLIEMQIRTTAGYEDFELSINGERLMHDYTWTYWVVSEPVITLKQGLHIVGNMMCDLTESSYTSEGYYFVYRCDNEGYDGAYIGRALDGNNIYKVTFDWLLSITSLIGTYLEMDSFTYPAKVNEIYVNAQSLSKLADDYNDPDSGRQQTWVPIGLEAMQAEIESLKARIAALEGN